MKSFLICIVVVALLACAAYFGFPVWYLNASPHVLIQPHSLISLNHPANEMEGANQKPEDPSPHPLSDQDAIQLMYLDQALETRMSAGFKQMHLPLPVLKIGVGTDGDFHVASIEFWLGEDPQEAVLERETLDVAYTAFRMVPALTEIDVFGVDHPDVREHRGQQLFTMNIQRATFWTANPRLSRHEQVAQLGTPWYSPKLGGTRDLEQEPTRKR